MLLSQQLSATRHPLTGLLVCFAVVASLLCSVSASVLHGLSLQWTAPFYVWRLLTGNAVEPNLLKAAFGVLGLLRFGPEAEEGLGTQGMALYLVVVCGIASAVTSWSMFVIYVITRFDYILAVELYGMLGMVSALAVASARFQDRNSRVVPAVAQPQVRQVPLLLTVVTGCLYIFGTISVSRDFPFVLVGSFAGWSWLRFAHLSHGSTFRGCAGPDFELASFFPDALAGAVRPLGTFCYEVAKLLGLFAERERELARLSAGSSSERPADPVAERRRTRGMKLLDQKLNSVPGDLEGGQSAVTVPTVNRSRGTSPNGASRNRSRSPKPVSPSSNRSQAA
jgi:hypothetical protein